jgi:hypothetical protein
VRFGRSLHCLLLAATLSLLVGTARADELTRLYAQILRDPTNSELNFRYAELAEQRGELRKALSAYERVLVNDPNHPQVMRALQRIRRKLQPNTTQFFTEFGPAWESNPRRVATGEQDEGLFLARATMRDERGFGNGHRWRTIGQLTGDIYFDSSDLHFGYAGAYTGPVVDITPTIAMHAALGGGAAYFAERYFFSEAIAHLTFESYLEGAYRTVRIRAGYRDFDDFFPSEDGFFADITGRFSFPNVIGQGDIFIVTPWARWSNFGGGGFSVFTADRVQPGRFTEFGGRLEYYRQLFERVSGGVGFAASHRDYLSDSREDLRLVPSAALIFHQVWGYQSDLKLEYRFEHNDSNDRTRDYENHIATMTLVSRF